MLPKVTTEEEKQQLQVCIDALRELRKGHTDSQNIYGVHLEDQLPISSLYKKQPLDTVIV